MSGDASRVQQTTFGDASRVQQTTFQGNLPLSKWFAVLERTLGIDELLRLRGPPKKNLAISERCLTFPDCHYFLRDSPGHQTNTREASRDTQTTNREAYRALGIDRQTNARVLSLIVERPLGIFKLILERFLEFGKLVVVHMGFDCD